MTQFSIQNQFQPPTDTLGRAKSCPRSFIKAFQSQTCFLKQWSIKAEMAAERREERGT